jgi:8-oxo-dGTP pyrophosphatase MutT (NUDIX family)
VAFAEDGKLVVIRRERAGHPVYRVFPGGGMQDLDRNEISALRRELDEEISGIATIHQLVHSLERTTSTGKLTRENFYLCRLQRFSFGGGSGPEANPPNVDNRYFVEAIDLSEASLRGASLLPAEVVELLIAASDPFALPALDP